MADFSRKDFTACMNDAVEDVQERIRDKISALRNKIIEDIEALEGEIEYELGNLDNKVDTATDTMEETREKRAYYTKRQMVLNDKDRITQSKHVVEILLTSVSKIKLTRTPSKAP